MKPIALTNNSLVYETMADKGFFSEIIYDCDKTHEGVLTASEGMIRKGHKLLMSPFLGNIPAYEMPYKTIVLSEISDIIDFNSLNIINAAIRRLKMAYCEKARAFWGKNDLDCLKKSDLVIIERWLIKVYVPEQRKEGGIRDGGR